MIKVEEEELDDRNQMCCQGSVIEIKGGNKKNIETLINQATQLRKILKAYCYTDQKHGT